jgi:hypothetical protein
MYLFVILTLLLTSCVDVNVKKPPCDCVFTIDTGDQQDAGYLTEDTEDTDTVR